MASSCLGYARKPVRGLWGTGSPCHARKPHAQQAISRAVAQLATQGLFPVWRIAYRLSCSLPLPLVVCRLMAGGTAWPAASSSGDRLDMGTCQGASTSAALVCAFPTLVMPPRDTPSPPGCSEGVSPH